MPEFRYVEDEFLFRYYVSAPNPGVPVLEFRGQLFLWAYLLSEAVRICAETGKATEKLFSRRLEIAREHYPADVQKLLDLESAWQPTVVDVMSPTRIALRPKDGFVKELPSVHFLLDQDGVTVRTEGAIRFPIPVRPSASHAESRKVAEILVRRGIELLEPFEGKKPQPLPA